MVRFREIPSNSRGFLIFFAILKRLYDKTIKIMKYKLLTLLFCIASLFLTSCGAMAQVVVATTIDTQLGTFTTYYDVYNDYPVIYHQGVPYCRYYFNDAWRYTVIPLEHRHMILHLDRPREFRHMPPPPHYRSYYGPSSTRHFHRPLPPQRHYRPHKERNFYQR